MRDWRNQLVDDVRALMDAAGANGDVTINGLAAMRLHQNGRLLGSDDRRI